MISSMTYLQDIFKVWYPALITTGLDMYIFLFVRGSCDWQMALIVTRPRVHTLSYRRIPAYPEIISVFLKSPIIFYKKLETIRSLDRDTDFGIRTTDRCEVQCMNYIDRFGYLYDLGRCGLSISVRTPSNFCFAPAFSPDNWSYNVLSYSKIPAFHISNSLLTVMYWVEAT